MAAALLCVAGVACVAQAATVNYARDELQWLEHSTATNRMASGDFDGDGAADLAFCYAGQRILVYSQMAGGNLKERTYQGPIEQANEPAPGKPWVYSVSSCRITAKDLNGDGLDDLIVTSSGGMVQLLARGDRGFDRQELTWWQHLGGGIIRSHGLIDINGDGVLDVVLHKYGSSEITAVLRTPEGRLGQWVPFKTVTSAHWDSDLAVGDLNGDGLPDLALVGSRRADFTGELVSSIELFMNKGGGNFDVAPGPALQPTWDVTHADIADVNGDGRADLVATSGAGVWVLVFEQQPNGTLLGALTYQAVSASLGIQAVDMDGDGLRDLVVNNGGILLGGYPFPGGLATYLQRSTVQVFDSVVGDLVNSVNDEPEAFAVGDFNADGCKDVVVGESGAYTRLSSTGCIRPPAADLGVGLEASDWRAIVTVRNPSSVPVAAGGLVRIHFNAFARTVEVTSAPVDCARSTPVPNAVVFTCPVAALALAESRSFVFTFDSKRALAEHLRITAAVDGPGYDPSIGDNRAVAIVAPRMRPTAAPAVRAIPVTRPQPQKPAPYRRKVAADPTAP